MTLDNPRDCDNFLLVVKPQFAVKFTLNCSQALTKAMTWCLMVITYILCTLFQLESNNPIIGAVAKTASNPTQERRLLCELIGGHGLCPPNLHIGIMWYQITRHVWRRWGKKEGTETTFHIWSLDPHFEEIPRLVCQLYDTNCCTALTSHATLPLRSCDLQSYLLRYFRPRFLWWNTQSKPSRATFAAPCFQHLPAFQFHGAILYAPHGLGAILIE